jgi:hypothetical protein
MSFVQRFTVTVTTNGSGAATASSDPIDHGMISQIRYVKTDFADGVDFAITLESTGETIWTQSNVNASATVAPRQATHGVTGTASLYASGGTAVEAPIAVANDRVAIAVTSGGAFKTGTFHILVV